MTDIVADHGRPATLAALAAALTGLFGVFLPAEAVPHVAAILAAVAALAGQYVPRRSLERKAALHAVGLDPLSLHRNRRR